jgi:hypothetical protein
LERSEKYFEESLNKMRLCLGVLDSGETSSLNFGSGFLEVVERMGL